jgi:tetratricopeptide (TPR) repeat protein
VTGKYPIPVGVRTEIDHLRDDLSRCEIWVVQIGMKTGSRSTAQAQEGQSGATEVDGLQLLHTLDQVADRIEQLQGRGADLRAEQGRFESVLGQLRRRGKAIVAEMNGRLEGQRPPDAHWWWHLDDYVATERNRRLKRTAAFVLGTLVTLGVLYFLYEAFLAPPPAVRQANAHLSDGERMVESGDLYGAIEELEAAVVLDPEMADAHLWLGVLYQMTDQGAKSDEAFARAREFYGGDSQFLFERGMLYLMLDDPERAGADAAAAIGLAPERPEGYFLQGSVAEQMGDVEVALNAFQRASDLAEATNQPALQVTARMHIAALLERGAAMPGINP